MIKRKAAITNRNFTVTTPGISLPRKLALHPYLKPRDDVSTTDPSCRGRNRGIVSTELLLHSSDDPKMDFLGREADDDADAQLKHYVAVVDPEKQTWQFVEVRKVTLRGAVRRLKPRHESEEESEGEEMVCSPVPSAPYIYIYTRVCVCV